MSSVWFPVYIFTLFLLCFISWLLKELHMSPFPPASRSPHPHPGLHHPCICVHGLCVYWYAYKFFAFTLFLTSQNFTLGCQSHSLWFKWGQHVLYVDLHRFNFFLFFTCTAFRWSTSFPACTTPGALCCVSCSPNISPSFSLK